jgi:hypothetical protein
MKPIVIDSKFIKRELWILLGCFIAAVIFDLVGIILYKRPAIELVTTIGYEVVIALGLYAFLALVRILVFLVSQLFKKKG